MHSKCAKKMGQAVQTHDFIYFLKIHTFLAFILQCCVCTGKTFLFAHTLTICQSVSNDGWGGGWGCVCVSEKMRKAIFASNGQCWKLLRFAQVGSAREARLGHCQAVLRDTSVQVSVGQSQRGGLASRLRLISSSGWMFLWMFSRANRSPVSKW